LSRKGGWGLEMGWWRGSGGICSAAHDDGTTRSDEAQKKEKFVLIWFRRGCCESRLLPKGRAYRMSRSIYHRSRIQNGVVEFVSCNVETDSLVGIELASSTDKPGLEGPHLTERRNFYTQRHCIEARYPIWDCSRTLYQSRDIHFSNPLPGSICVFHLQSPSSVKSAPTRYSSIPTRLTPQVPRVRAHSAVQF